MPHVQEIVSSAIFKFGSLLNLFVFMIGILFEGSYPLKPAAECFRWTYSDADWDQYLSLLLRRQQARFLGNSIVFVLGLLAATLVISNQEDYWTVALPIFICLFEAGILIFFLPYLRSKRFDWREVTIFQPCLTLGKRIFAWQNLGRTLQSIDFDQTKSTIIIHTLADAKVTKNTGSEFLLYVPSSYQSEVFKFFKDSLGARGG
jgi:hypothetical protein